MQVCNISFQVNPSIQDSWLAWMKTSFLPQMEATGCFNDYKLYQLEVTEDQYPTYTLQMYAQSTELLDKWFNLEANSLLEQLYNHWGEDCLYFSTKMTIVH